MTGDAGPTAASTVALEEEANVSRSPREEHVGKTRTVVQGRAVGSACLPCSRAVLPGEKPAGVLRGRP